MAQNIIFSKNREAFSMTNIMVSSGLRENIILTKFCLPQMVLVDV